MALEFLTNANIGLIKENIDFLNQIKQHQYNYHSAAHEGEDSIGVHIRKIFNKYEAVLNGLRRNEVDYDMITRNANAIENDLEAGKQFSKDIYTRFVAKRNSPNYIEKEMFMKKTIYHNNQPILIPAPTSLRRELINTYNHTIKHDSKIKMIISETDDIFDLVLPTYFGRFDRNE